MARYKKYQKDLSYTYTAGIFSTIEVLEQRPTVVKEVLLRTKTKDSAGVGKILELAARNKIKISYDDAQITKLSGAENHQTLAIFDKYEIPLDQAANHVVLVNPTDMGNLGTIIRTMAGFDVLDLAIIKPGVDHFDPKVIRASMGAIFQMRVASFNSFTEYKEQFHRNYYPLMTSGRDIGILLPLRSPYSLVFGPEGAGLSEDFKNFGIALRLPQSGRIDSLNLAIAVGITLYAAREA